MTPSKIHSIPQEITDEVWEQSCFNKNGRFRRWIRSAYADGLTIHDIIIGLLGNPCNLPAGLYQQTYNEIQEIINDRHTSK